jgi:hypothetical protein
VDFIDEKNGTLLLRKFLHNGFEALFEIAAIFGAG